MADPTVRDILTTAYRKIGVGQPGVAMSGALADEGLSIFQGALEELVNGGMFAALTDVLTDVDYTAKENERIRYTGTAVVTIPTAILDLCTGLDRSPRDLSSIIVVKAATDPQISLYDALLGGWVRLDSLTLNSAAPLARRGRDGLAAWVAVKLAGATGFDVLPSVAREAAKFMAALTGRFGSARRETIAEYF